MLARRADLEGSGRSAAKPPADSSEDSESEGDSGDDDAVAIRVKQQQQQQQDYHHQQQEENLRIERELHNLRQEQALLLPDKRCVLFFNYYLHDIGV